MEQYKRILLKRIYKPSQQKVITKRANQAGAILESPWNGAVYQ